jgi:hypothetical protein
MYLVHYFMSNFHKSEIYPVCKYTQMYLVHYFMSNFHKSEIYPKVKFHQLIAEQTATMELVPVNYIGTDTVTVVNT